MKLVIVESPAKAKTINKYLGKDYQVLASFGHVRDLPGKEGSVRPDEDFAMDYEISSQSLKHMKSIVDAVKKADGIYLATDPDREGEAISWHIVEALKKRKALKKDLTVQRIVFYEVTKKAVNEAIKKPRDIDMDLVNAQQARRALDYLVGFTLSPVLWRKLPGSKSAGRVQSVALRLICEREAEIEVFNPREYWDITLKLDTAQGKPFSARLTHVEDTKLDQFDIPAEKDAADIVAQLQKKDFLVSNVTKKQVRRNPQPPFTTSSLQQEAARKLGFGAKRTMQVAQKLYEGIATGGEVEGLITYMRTDGVTVGADAIDVARSVISNKYGKEFVPEKHRFYKTKAKNAQEAHEAIRPTDISKIPSEIEQYLDVDQYKLYDLIWKRMVASQMESAVLDQVVADIKAKDNYATARASGSTVRFDGFFRVYKEGRDDDSGDDDEKKLPPMEANEDVAVREISPDQHFTQPPPRYSEASLVKKLEELGIGRPSTYASIISVLQDRQYVVLDKKRFMAEDRGRIVTAFLTSFFSRYVQYDFTANLEDELDQVSDGKMDWKALLRQFWGDFDNNIQEVFKLSTTEVIRELNQLLGDFLFPKDDKGEIDRKCPSCDEGKLSLKLGKFGAFLGCSAYPECRHTKQLGGGDEGGAALTEPKLLGTDKESGLDVTIRKGPYGFYIQMGEAEEDKKPKRVTVPKNIDIEAMTLEDAQGLLSLPRRLGTHPDTGKVISAGIGRFGPYLRHDGKFTSLKEDDVLGIGINRAVTVIAESPKGKTVEPLKVYGKHPDTGQEIAVFEGRYGPYVKHGKTNASLPKGVTVEETTLESALELIAKKEGGAKGKAKKAPAKKKPAAKKKAPAKKKKG